MQIPTARGYAATATAGYKFSKALIAAACVASCLPGQWARAAGGPENLVLVVNARSQASLAVANHYIQLRRIPRENVIYLTSVLDRERVQLRHFRDHILKPVLDQIDERRIGDHIDYIVYSADFPTAIAVEEHVQKLKQLTEIKEPRLFRPFASINSLTYFFRSVMANDPSYLALTSNWYMRSAAKGLLDVPFVGAEQQEYLSGVKSYRDGDFSAATSVFRRLAEKHPQQVAVQYYLARALAKNEQAEQAIEALVQATRGGWCYQTFTREDSAFANLKDNPLFQRVVDGISNERFPILPTRGFEGSKFWGPNGWPNGEETQGKRLVLSTVLAVTRNRGTTLDEALEYLTISAGADGTFPKGTFYFTETNDVRTKTRKSQFGPAIDALREMNLQGEIVRGRLPKNKPAVLGATIGTREFDWKSYGSKIVPGAICENLTSYGGVMRKDSSQTTLAEFLRNGAAGSSGTVFEPLSVPQKFPHAMIQVHYARGCTLAEAFYQSVHGPFQLLIVGDPLCRPWAKLPEFEVSGFTDGQVVTDELRLEMIPKTEKHIRRFELYLDGRRLAIGDARKLELPVEQLSDGYHELRIVAVENSPIATTASKTIEFTVDVAGRHVSMECASNKIRKNEALKVTVTTNLDGDIQILQNQRVVGSVKGPRGVIDISGSQLGLGKSRLFAIAAHDDRTVTSQPLEIEVQ